MRPASPLVARIALAGFLTAMSLSIQPAVGAPPAPQASPAATPVAAVTVSLLDARGREVGTARFAEGPDHEVRILVQVSGLTPGPHGIHIHDVGVCNPAGRMPFDSAGTHFNPTEGSHGAPGFSEGHAGDLGNIVVGPAGSGQLDISSTKISLAKGPVTLADKDGSAIVIHARGDDMKTDPDGKSGERIACGVVFAPAGG